MRYVAVFTTLLLLGAIFAAAQEELPKRFLYDGLIHEELTPLPKPHEERRETLRDHRDDITRARGEADAQKFHGTWRLISFENVDENGERRARPMGGQLTYTKDGLMSAQLMPEQEEGGDGSTRPYYAYFGTYQVNPETKTVSHKVEGSNVSAWVGTTLVRHYTFDANDRLVLTVKENDRDTIILEWARTELPPAK